MVQKEYKLRNGSELILDFGKLDLSRKDYAGYQLLLTVARSNNDDDEYRKYKEEIQNKINIPHQHLTKEHMKEDSVMALIMQLSLKLGGDPWLLSSKFPVSHIIGIHGYLNPESGKRMALALILDSQGSLMKQFDPVSPEQFPEIVHQILDDKEDKKRLLFICSYDRFGLIPQLLAILHEKPGPEYSVLEIDTKSTSGSSKLGLPGGLLDLEGM